MKKNKREATTVDDNPIMTLSMRCQEMMPHRGSNKKPLSSIENLRFLLNELDISCRYNIISKRIEINIPNVDFSVDNYNNASLGYVYSKIKQIQMSADGYREYLLIIADNNQYNPVETWIMNKRWDGKTRLPELYETIEARHQKSANAFLFRWLIGAVASACSPNGLDSAGIIVLQGAQDLGKTWWFRKLVPEDQLPDITRADAMIDPHDKDSVSQVICKWLVELGELDATFKKSELAALKAFLTRNSDTFRRPFAPDDSKYPRRTVFMASVNPWHFLTDETGNRRFWTIECKKINSYHTMDMQQLWAEMHYKWKQGASWKLSEEEKGWLRDINDDHLAQDPLADTILRRYDWESNETYWRNMSATEVCEELSVGRITRAETRICADTLRKLSARDSQPTSKGRKFLVPPLR